MTKRKKHLVFITRQIPEAGIQMLSKKGFLLKVWPQKRKIGREELLKGVKGASAILSLLTEKIDEEVLDAAGKNLKIVANYAVGYDNIDIEACKKRKIWVTNTPGVLTETVAEHTMGLILAVSRHISEGDRFVRAGRYKQWEPMLFLGTQLYNKTIGIVGLGRIGTYLAQMAFSGFHMKVVYHDVRRNEEFEEMFEARYLSLNELLKVSDFVSLHVPLLPETFHLISKPEFKLMKRTAYLINTSRGLVVDEKALYQALKDGQIAGAAIDVYEFEPHPVPGLIKLPNIVFTPHIASATLEAREMMAKMAAENIIQALTGKKPKDAVFEIEK